MKPSNYAFSALAIWIAGAALSGCGGLQPPIESPAAMQQRQSIVDRTALSPSYQVLYHFRGGSDGAYPFAGLTDVKGTLYGTTSEGGTYNLGTIFSVTTAGTKDLLYSFRGGSDGQSPSATLTNINGTLYGTTSGGGGSGCSHGCGTVFSVTTTGTEKVVYSFRGGSDGADPSANLVNVNGTLYGTTYQGGFRCRGSHGCGTVYRISTTGNEKLLYSFGGGSDGANPEAGLTNVDGLLYGTTNYGGSSGRCCGTVFSMTTTGKKKLVYSFKGFSSDGSTPIAGLIDAGGTLYGATNEGGAYNHGVVFSVTPSGTEKVLHSFGKGSDGAFPYAGLIDVNHILYGTTDSGGSGCGSTGCGTVFSITTTGTEKVLHSFRGGCDGVEPLASLIDVKGTLYGTTYSGRDTCHGRTVWGIVFALNP
jgi:uncharacterized repeat protein (TIGR03803 family)